MLGSRAGRGGSVSPDAATVARRGAIASQRRLRHRNLSRQAENSRPSPRV